MLLPSILALLASSPSLHAGPPVFIEVEVNDEGVSVVVTSEQEALLAWMGREVPIAQADSTAELESALALEAARLLRDERGLDLLIDGETVTYEVGEVKLFDEFGVGNTEPSIQLALTVDDVGQSPSSIGMSWGLFDRVEEESKRVLPILISAGGEFDLLRANELEPTALWESVDSAAAKRAGEGLEVLEPMPALKAPPRVASASRARMWRATRVSLYFLAALCVLTSLRSGRSRARFIVLGCGALLFFGARMLPGEGEEEGRLLPDEALALFGKLHESVYLAFSGRSEDEIYERLAVCVSGPLLDELYSEVLKGLVLEDDGGAICRVEEVEATEGALVSLEDRPGFPSADESFGVDWTWRVRGRVIHYGHEHIRENRYRAHYRVSPVEGAWRITEVDVLEHERTELD